VAAKPAGRWVAHQPRQGDDDGGVTGLDTQAFEQGVGVGLGVEIDEAMGEP
jgi:hypothetical protein